MGRGEVVGGRPNPGWRSQTRLPRLLSDRPSQGFCTNLHEARDLNREWLDGLQVPEPKTQKEATHIWADELSLSRTILASGSSISASDNNRFASS